MTGLTLIAVGIYTIIMGACGTEPTVFGGIVQIGIGLICIVISSRRGDHD